VPLESSDAELLSALAGFRDKRRLLQKAGLDLETCIKADAILSGLEASKAAWGKDVQPPPQQSSGRFWPLVIVGSLMLLALVLWGVAFLMHFAAFDLFRPVYAFIVAAAVSVLALLCACMCLCKVCCSRERKPAAPRDPGVPVEVIEATQPPSAESILAFSSGPSQRRPNTTLADDAEMQQMPSLENVSQSVAGASFASTPSGHQSMMIPGALDNYDYGNNQLQQSLSGFAINTPAIPYTAEQGWDVNCVVAAERYMEGTPPAPFVSDIQTILYHNPEYSFASRFSKQAAAIAAKRAREDRKAGRVASTAAPDPVSKDGLAHLVVDVPACAREVEPDLRPHMKQFWRDTMFQSDPKYPNFHPASKKKSQ